ncbi:MAG: peptidoglycan DD-metalloendopeptidase family protein [Gammaproteobacteria bacterium]|nr:peptidoglycan DD-metalloendopeptidase family protein [Gammaproteobacteria bacterium]
MLTACSNALRWQPDYHTVRSGETLFSIAMRYNLDYRQIASWNQLGSGTYIRQGQRLRLKPGAANTASQRNSTQTRSTVSTTTVLPAPTWRWPTRGSVLLRFGASSKTNSGIRIGGVRGQSIYATAAGEVVYAGTGLRSYGQLLILKHNETWLSAYGFNSKLLVAEGDRVQSGQKIAEMGADSGGKPLLHFEIRRNGQPVDPLRYLPAR